MYAPVTLSGTLDLIAWAEGIDHLLRNGCVIEGDLSLQGLAVGNMVTVSAAAGNKPQTNRDICAPADFYPMPSIAYRLAKVAAGDGICGLSLYSVAAHIVVAGHALLIGAKGVLINESGKPIRYQTDAEMAKVCQRCLGGAPDACLELAEREWARVFEAAAN